MARIKPKNVFKKEQRNPKSIGLRCSFSYVYLVCCAGQKDVCWPSMKTIALHCGCSENAARDAVKLLTDREFIRKGKTSKSAKSGKWLQGNNHYYILPLLDLPAADHSA